MRRGEGFPTSTLATATEPPPPPPPHHHPTRRLKCVTPPTTLHHSLLNNKEIRGFHRFSVVGSRRNTPHHTPHHPPPLQGPNGLFQGRTAEHPESFHEGGPVKARCRVAPSTPSTVEAVGQKKGFLTIPPPTPHHLAAPRPGRKPDMPSRHRSGGTRRLQVATMNIIPVVRQSHLRTVRFPVRGIRLE